MTGYNQGELCRLADKINRNPELAKKLGISIVFHLQAENIDIEKEEQDLDEGG